MATDSPEDKPKFLPLSNWHDYEHGRENQLVMRDAVDPPTIAERAFVALSVEWRSIAANIEENHPLPPRSDQLALACLLLSVEWGKEFTNLISEECLKNLYAAQDLGSRAWFIRESWKLCGEFSKPGFCGDSPYYVLLGNLSHHNSPIRDLLLDIAWIVRNHLPVELATKHLLCNIADKILGVTKSAGIVFSLYPSSESFKSMLENIDCRELLEELVASGIRNESPDELVSLYVEQFQERLVIFDETGWKLAQSGLWEMENECRKVIETAILGLRFLRPVGPKDVAEGENPDAT